MTNRKRKNNSGSTLSANERLIGSAYSYYGGVVKTTARPATAGGVKRLLAAALLSGASIVAVGVAGAGTARAGSCNETNSTVICTGPFDDAIYQTSVEDLTVILGSGASIDTTARTSTGPFDNAGIVVTGDNDLSVLNYGSIVTGDNAQYDEGHGWVYGGYLHHGISAFSDNGSTYALNSEQGTIVVTADRSHGILVATAADPMEGGDAKAINHGWIATSGEWSYGISAVSANSAEVRNNKNILTSGKHGTGIYAGGGYEAIVVNDGLVQTTGKHAGGIFVAVEGDGSSFSVQNNGSIETSGKDSYGIVVSASGGAGTITNSGSITTQGREAAGIGGNGGTITVVNTADGTIDTEGKRAYGVALRGDTIALENAGEITTSGKKAHAVVVRSVGPETTTVVNSGVIAATGRGADGIVASGPTVYIHNQLIESDDDEPYARGVVYSRHSAAIRVDDADDVHIYNGGDIIGNVTVEANNHAYVLNEGLIQSDRKKKAALSVEVEEGSAVVVNSGTVVTGAHSHKGGWRSHGIDVYGAEEAFVLNTGMVTTYGGKANGIVVSTETGVAIGINAGTIETSGDDTTGLLARGGSGTHHFDEPYDAIHRDGHAVAGNIGQIETWGDDATGLAAITEGGIAAAFNVLGGSVVTEGEDSHGVIAASGFDGIDDPFWHDGTRGFAIAVNGLPPALLAGLGGVIGGSGYGFLSEIAEALDEHPPQDDGFDPADLRSYITTTGDGAIGLGALAEGGSAVAANLYGTVTTGLLDDGGHAYSGEEAHGVRANATNAAIAVNGFDSQVTTHGSGALGVGAFSDAGTAYAINVYSSSIITHGDGAAGLIASADSYYDCDTDEQIGGDAFALNLGSDITTYGYESAGIIASSGAGSASVGNMTVFAEEEDGEDMVASIVTHGDGAHGVSVRAWNGTATLTNRGDIVTHGEKAHGAKIQGDTARLYNEGTIHASGDGAHAVVISSESVKTTTVENAGTIQADGTNADALRASGPTVLILNTEDGSIIAADGAAIYAFGASYVGIANEGEISGDVLVASGGEYGYGGEVHVLNTGTITGNLDTSLSESHDTIVVDGGTVTGAIHTGDGQDNVTVQGEGVVLGKGIHATAGGVTLFAPPPEDSHAALTFVHDDEITLDDGIEGWAISNFDTVDIDSGRLVLDGVGIQTRDGEGEINVAEDAVLATTGEGADVVAANVAVFGTLDIGLGGFFAATGDVSFGEDSTFFTRIENTSAGVVSGNTVTFAEGSTIFADVTGNIDAAVGEDILIASASQTDGVTDHGAVVKDNTFLFYFEKVMNGEITETGSADELFLRVQIEETAFDTADDAAYTQNQLSIADALDVYLQTQPLSSPLVKWLSGFETEEEQRDALLKAIKDTLPEESNGTSTATISSTDMIYDMIMDRLSGGGFTVAQNGESGLAAGDAVLGGDGKWALWGRVGASRAKFTPSNVNGFDADSRGMTAGIDGEIAANTRIGVSAFYIASDVEENGAGANATNDITGYGLTAYATYRPGTWYVNGALGYGMNEYESRRQSIGGVNSADYDGTQFVARAEAGQMFTFGQWDVTPNVGLRYNRVDIDAYTETGPLPISVNSQTVESLRAVAGVNLRYSHLLESGGKIIPEFGVKVLGELADPDQAITGNVVGGGAFTTGTTSRDDVSYGVGAGLTWEMSDRFSLRITYDAELQSDYDEQAVAAALRLAF